MASRVLSQPGLRGAKESDPGDEQQGGVQDAAAVVLDEGLLLLVPAALHDLFEDRRPGPGSSARCRPVC